VTQATWPSPRRCGILPESRAIRKLTAATAAALDYFRIADITGQFLPVLMVSRMMDALWGDLQPEAEILPHETKIRLEKNNTPQKNLL
jgi:hypothetical protein